MATNGASCQLETTEPAAQVEAGDPKPGSPQWKKRKKGLPAKKLNQRGLAFQAVADPPALFREEHRLDMAQACPDLP